MSSVVTGATGCLGLNLTKRLLREGHEVIALGRNERLGNVISQMGARFVVLDLQEQARLKELCLNADLIFHCAALSSPWGRYSDFYRSNVMGTQNVINATPSHARLIHVSSPSIYFDFTEKYDIHEDAPLPAKPANHYIKSKLLAEQLIDKAFEERSLNVVTLRPRAIFGPYDRAILPRLLQAEKNGVLPMIGSGENLIDVTYVDNVVESLLLAAFANSTVCGKKYNITNAESTKLIDIVSLLFSALHKPLKIRHISYPRAHALAYCLENIFRYVLLNKEPPITQYSAGVLALGQTLNIDAAKRDLHYKPIASIEQGINEFARWYGALK